MSITTLVCTILQGYGAVTLYPGVVESPRYEGASVTITTQDDVVLDVVVDGPFDKRYSYTQHGLKFTLRRFEYALLMDAASVAGSKDVLQESFVFKDDGRFLWSQLATADALKAASISVFSGTCEVQ